MQFGKRTHKPNSVYAVIPQGAALPRTLISDLPGGFDNCWKHPSDEDLSPGAPFRTVLPHRADAQPASGSRPRLPSLFGLATCGVYPATAITGCAVRSYRTFSPLPQCTGQLQRAAPRSGGGMFSVALAVHGPLSPRPGRYPAHCPAEFGLSSPGNPCLRKAFRQRPPGPPARH